MAEREKFSPPAVGGISLLVVFAVLCLTVFALLSLATVQADGRLGDASARAVEDYYAADCTAQAVLAWLRTGERGDAVPEDLTVSTTFADYGGRFEEVRAFTVPISDTQELQVEVRVDGADYEILRWQAVPTGGWDLDGGLDVWDGLPPA